MSVLDEKGAMVCDAQIILEVTYPDGTTSILSTDFGNIIRNQECRTKSITIIPDFQSTIPISQSGTYKLNLTAITTNGIYSITDSFQSQYNPEITIKRLMSTRIYPPNIYPVILEITPVHNFTGTISEIVPSSFMISNTTASVSQQDSSQILSWNVSLKANQTTQLEYSYLAPQVSPERYLLGPLTFNETNNLKIFTEPRQWQIASDNIATTLTVTAVGTSQWTIPDNVYSISVQAWGGGGGGVTRGTNGVGGGGGGGAYAKVNSSIVSPGVGITIFVGGGGTTQTTGGDSYIFNTNTGIGNTIVKAKGGLGIGSSNSSVGASGGSAASCIGDTVFSGGGGAAGVGNSAGGGGGAAGDSAAGNNTTTYRGGVGGAGNIGFSGGNGGVGRTGSQGNGVAGSVAGGGGGGAYRSSSSARAGGVGAAGKVIISYIVNEAPNTPTNTTPGIGTTTVSTTPTLTASAFSDPDPSDTQSSSQFQVAIDSGCNTVVWDTGTTGPASNNTTVTSALNIDTTYYWHVKYRDNRSNWSNYSACTSFTTNVKPNAPTNYSPTNSATGVTQTPTLIAMATDNDGNNLQYQFKLCTNSALSVGCTTYTAANTGWSGADIGTSAYSSGTTASYIIQSPLATGTKFYWQSQAIDYSGSNTLSNASIGFSFTTSIPQAVPNTPTLIQPLDIATSQSQTPTFKTVTTDTNNDNLQYEIKVCPNSDMVTGCSTFNAASTGWSGADVGTTSYSTGTTAVYIVPVGSSLVANTLYYWKTRAIDPTGSNTYSSTQASPYSFTTLNNLPITPSNNTPSGGTGGVALTPTLTASAYSDPDPGDSQTASQWQVATDTDFSSIVFDTGTSGSVSNSVSVTTTLNIGTTYYWHVRYQDSHSGWSNYSSYTNFTTNFAPSIPTLTSPTNNATGITQTPTFQLVTTDNESENLQYQIILGGNTAFTGTTQTFDQTVSNVGWSAQNVGTSAYSSGTTAAYIIQIPLTTNTLYYWKAKAKDYAGSNTWSNLSVGFSFTTLNNLPITPSNNTPSGGTGGVALTPTLTASAYSDPDPGDSQTASQWQVATDTDFSSIVFDTGTSGSVSNSVSVTTTLNIGTTYYWHVRYQDSHSGWSNYSSYTNFTTNFAPSIPTLTSPTNNATGITQTPTFQLVTTDNESENLQYQIILGGNTAFTGTTQTFDQTVSNVGWSAQNVGTSAYSSGTTAAYIIQIPLTTNTLYYWKAKAKDYAGSNTWSNLSVGFSFTTLNNLPITPSNNTPSGGTGGVALTPTLTASAYSDPDPGDSQTASQWQVATDTDFSSIVFDTGTSGSVSNSVSVTTTLNIGTTYYWHVRYQDSHSGWSNYSSYTNFLTKRSPNIPNNISPSNQTNNVSRNPTLTGSDYYNPDGDDQIASQWQIASDSSFNNLIWDTGTTDPVTSITVPIQLNVGTTYYWHVRYESNPWSSYSPTTFFVTLSGTTSPTTSFKIKGVKIKGIKFK